MRQIRRIISVFLTFCLAAAPAAADYAWLTYDNCDGDHASISIASFPGIQVRHTLFGPQTSVIPDAVVLGNASVAYTTGENWGSVVRNVYMEPWGAAAGYNQYISNNAYWHPEHRDHDDKDHYHAMTPVVSNSQGSSGSEIDEMHKWLRTMNAFPADVKDRLTQEKLVFPTIQMIARRSRVASDAAYLTGAAHPNAFPDAANEAAMIAMAAGMTAATIPPFVKIRVESDDYDGVRGVDFFEQGGSERLYDTPVSIARFFRGREFTHTAVLTSEDSFDPNGRALTHHWAVLRGNPAGVRITPLNASASRVRVEIDYHPETTVAGSALLTNLVVVGAFVHNGAYYSPPAFFTSWTMANEARAYTSGRLTRVDYNANYVKPSYSLPKAWTSDEFRYDAGGRLTGWVRTQGATTSEFTPEGYLVVAKDGSGRVTSAQNVYYRRQSTAAVLEWVTSGSPFPYNADAGKPEIAWQSPEDGATVQGTATVSAAITDPDGIASVILRANGEMVKSFTAAPYTFEWTPEGLPAGPVTLEFEATDFTGRTSWSARTVQYVPAPAAADEVAVRAYPNPFRADRAQAAAITIEASAGSTARIYTAAGRLVREIGDDGAGRITWDLRNDANEAVASGLYLYSVKLGSGGTRTGPLMVIR